MHYLYLVFFLYIITSRIILNSNADVNGAFQASSASYSVALMTILFIILIILPNIKKLKISIRIYFLLLLPFLYYVFALLTSFASLLPTISLFRSFTGLGFIAVGIIVGKYIISASGHQNLNYNHYYKLLLIVTFSGIASSLLFSIIQYNNFKIHAGSFALLYLYIGIWHFIDYVDSRKSKDIFVFLFILITGIELNSFSSYIAIYVTILSILFIRNYFSLSLALIIMPFILYPIITLYLEQNINQTILGKSAGAYLIGSGRFEVYRAALDVYLNLDMWQKFFGIGFMSEREILFSYDLTWSTDPHNSLIVSTLGLGIVGLLFYIIFLLTPFIFYKKIKKLTNKNISTKWLSMHIHFLIFGITSSTYLAAPTIQLILFIAFCNLIGKKLNE